MQQHRGSDEDRATGMVKRQRVNWGGEQMARRTDQAVASDAEVLGMCTYTRVFLCGHPATISFVPWVCMLCSFFLGNREGESPYLNCIK
jgi:hypothetical protein